MPHPGYAAVRCASSPQCRNGLSCIVSRHSGQRQLRSSHIRMHTKQWLCPHRYLQIVEASIRHKRVERLRYGVLFDAAADATHVVGFEDNTVGRTGGCEKEMLWADAWPQAYSRPEARDRVRNGIQGPRSRPRNARPPHDLYLRGRRRRRRNLDGESTGAWSVVALRRGLTGASKPLAGADAIAVVVTGGDGLCASPRFQVETPDDIASWKIKKVNRK
jgi:hypothetical protein